jgi:hypothetical protein
MISAIDAGQDRRGYAPEVTQSSRSRANPPTRNDSNSGHELEMRAMSTTTRRPRTPYARALYAAAIAALLSACAQAPDPTPTVSAAEASSAESAADASMPEVVIVASRERPDSRG